mgnify:CR=1 FL=1
MSVTSFNQGLQPAPAFGPDIGNYCFHLRQGRGQQGGEGNDMRLIFFSSSQELALTDVHALIQIGSYQLGGLFLIEIKDRVDYGFGFHEYRNIGLESLILADTHAHFTELSGVNDSLMWTEKNQCVCAHFSL